MGCTPSHSDIANHHANHGTKPLNKGILPVDPGGEGFSLPLLIKCSSSYEIDDLSQGETQIKDNFFRNASDEDKNVNFRSSTEDPLLSELDQEEKDTEGTISEAEIALSGLTGSQKHIAEDIKVKKQNSWESKEVGFDLKNKNENNEKQIAKKAKKQKHSRQGKQGRDCKTKEKSSPPVCQAEKKVDFPDLLVKAHQNAYAYLNPNLSKYEVILCMANQATETQLILQQMVSFLLFRFDEINHLLEEIAQDGEDLLKEVGGNLAWPPGKGSPQEQPDLLQQLLQYTVNKMQMLNGTVASLTSNALQESCSFLQSAGSNLEEKLKAKQGFDERLFRTIKLLETSAVKPFQPHPDDMTLYSEDSGIGIDSESVKDLNVLDKQGMQTNCGSWAHDHPSQNQTRISGEHQWACSSVYATTRSHDCALERHFKDIFYAPSHKKGVSSLGIVPEGSVTISQCQNITQALSLTSVPPGVTHEVDCFKECESNDVFPTNEDIDDDSLSEEEDDNMSETRKDVLSKRLTSPIVAADSKRRLSMKRLESPENEEIILKMKDAISEKIKFVPAKSGKREWMEDENGRGSPRPSTATESQKTQVKQKRSKSEESLRSRAEDPTLLELQRTQKGLSKRLEMFYTHNGNKETNEKPGPTSPKEPFNLQDCEHITHRSSTNKLKASLAKNFSILPNQDKVPLLRHDQNVISQQPDERRCRKPFTTTMSSQHPISRKENEPPGSQKLNSVGCTPPRKSVKKLIETFSPPEGLVKSASLRPLGPIKCIRKFGLPSIPPSFPIPRALVPLSHKHRVSPLGEIHNPTLHPTHCAFGSSIPPVFASESDTNEETEDESEMENLPPPPPEMLLGISCDSAESLDSARTEKNYSKVAKKPAKTNDHRTTRKISQISQRMKASLCSMDLLPSKNLSSLNPIANKAPKNTGVDPKPRKYSLESNASLMSDYIRENSLTSQRYHEMQETAELYKESHKIIPLRNPKEMPEQNESDSASKECCTPLTPAQKQSSSDSLGKSGKVAGFVRQMSPARTPPSSPPSEKRLPSPPLHQRHSRQAFSSMTHRQPSPPAGRWTSSPPAQRKLPSPPTQQNLSSPPLGRKQQSPPTRSKVSSPPVHRKEASPPPFLTTPSPPASPSWLHKGLQNYLDLGDEQQSASPKIVTNAHSIFCPATSSLFEAKPLLPPNSSATEMIMGHPEGFAFSRRNSTQLRQHGDPQKRMALSAMNPQPFVRRSFSDRRPGFQIPLPLFASAGSEPVLSKTR
ncbi:photoreceptor cilium actin regulator [Hemicordylus capensis]|uniref:photoreceptor cilium actin regulator n=1 Tax=Hemicordylus capensis TaxID=884348 RepID=UPI00230292AC|nr:photoreceptor cilium actin regulator [Hemicordylus capensis]